MTQPKALGSIYINPPKDTEKDTVEKLIKAKDFLKKHKTFCSITIKKTAFDNLEADSNGYVALVGYFNGYKQTNKDKDLYIVPRLEQPSGSKKSAASAPPADDDECPFE